MPSGFTIPDAAIDTISSRGLPPGPRSGLAPPRTKKGVLLRSLLAVGSSLHRKLKALKTEWIYEIHTREDKGLRPLAYYMQAGGATGPTDSDNGQSLRTLTGESFGESWKQTRIFIESPARL